MRLRTEGLVQIMQEVIIGKNEAGQRFDKFLGKYFKAANTSFIYKMLRKKNIELNSKKATGNEKLNVGDSVKFFMADETIAKFRGCVISGNASERVISKKTEETSSVNVPNKKNVELITSRVIYEDEHILLVDKPAGILSQKATPTDVSINEMIIDYLIDKGDISVDELQTFKPSVCNRLDRNTTGLITFGKTLAGTQALSQGFKDRTFDKYYLAIVWGHIVEPSLIDGYLIKDEKSNKVTISSKAIKDSSPIHTYYEPVRRGYVEINGKDKAITLLKIKLITGKTHQIRAHLASIGHSLLGDDKYGVKVLNESLKKQYKIKFQMLHSYQLHIGEDQGNEALDNIKGKCITAKPAVIYDNLFK